MNILKNKCPILVFLLIFFCFLFYEVKSEISATTESSLRAPLDTMIITSRFGMRMHPIQKRQLMHYGIDYRAAVGTVIYAVDSGVVIKAHEERGWGRVIEIRHPNGNVSLYAHLSRFNVTRGQSLNRGDVIGFTGDSGRVTGPHLHFGYRVNNIWIDPDRLFVATNKVSQITINNEIYPPISVVPNSVWLFPEPSSGTTSSPEASSGTTRRLLEIELLVRGQSVIFDDPPLYFDNVLLAPLQPIVKSLGAVAEWRGDEVSIRHNNKSVVAIIGQNNFSVIDSHGTRELVSLPLPAGYVNQIVYFPIIEIFGELDVAIDYGRNRPVNHELFRIAFLDYDTIMLGTNAAIEAQRLFEAERIVWDRNINALSSESERQSMIDRVYGASGIAERLNDELMEPIIRRLGTVLDRVVLEYNFHFVYDNADGRVVWANARYLDMIPIWDGMGIDINQSIIRLMNIE